MSNIAFARVILPSAAPRALASFLSEFLDLEVHEEKQQYVMDFDHVQFVVTASGEAGIHSTQLEFKVSSKEELGELWQKYQFTLYRHSENPVKGAKPVHIHEGREQFEAIDLDGRCWRFIVDE